MNLFKTVLIPLFLILVFSSCNNSSDVLEPLGDNISKSLNKTTICWEPQNGGGSGDPCYTYAVITAFLANSGQQLIGGNGPLDPMQSDLDYGGIPSEYFEQVSINDIQAGDIVEFNGHAAYAISSGSARDRNRPGTGLGDVELPDQSDCGGTGDPKFPKTTGACGDPISEIGTVSAAWRIKDNIDYNCGSSSNPAAPTISASWIRIARKDHPKISWASVQGADGYKLYRKIEDYPGDPNGTYTLFQTTSGTSYTDLGFCSYSAPSQRLKVWYKVRAYNDVGDSANSNYVGFTVEALE